MADTQKQGQGRLSRWRLLPDEPWMERSATGEWVRWDDVQADWQPTDILAVAKAIVSRAMKEGDVPSIRQLARDYIRLREADRQRRATDAVAGAVMPRVPPGRGL